MTLLSPSPSFLKNKQYLETEIEAEFENIFTCLSGAQMDSNR